MLTQLVARGRWARARLASLGGQWGELRPPLLRPLRMASADGGRIEEGGPEPAAVVTIQGVSGSSPLADELRYLAKHLRWEAEEELSKVVGDVAAERIGGALRAFGRWQLDAAQRLSEALADYATAESGALVRRSELRDFAAEVERLHAAIARLC